jgi:RHS repeat-associated protein
MRIAVWRLGMCVLCCAAGMLGYSPVALAEVSASGEEALVFPGAPSPLSGLSASETEAVRRNSPEAVMAREESLTKYEGLDSQQVAKLASEVFPAVVDDPAGGPPQLPAGQGITAFLADDAARVDLGEGKHGVIESLAPMAVEAEAGRVPIDLGLKEAGGVFEPRVPLVGLRIPKRLSDGVGLAATGVSLTPVDGQGSSLGGSEGSVDGATVLYANTQADADTVVKPTTGGFEADTVLRSVNSPQQMFFRVGLPAGATLTQTVGGVRILKEGATLAAIPVPSARDAAGTPVPVSMTVSGDTLILTAAARSAEYEYPILVDPTVNDTQLDTVWGEGGERPSNWREEPAPPSPFKFEEFGSENLLLDVDRGTSYVRGEWGAMAYETRPNTHIYKFVSETSAANAGNNIEEKLFISSPGKGIEKQELPGDNYPRTKKELCVEAGCTTGTVSAADEKNVAEFQQTATNPGTEFESELFNPSVDILQEKSPTASINTTSETIKGGPNPFFHGKWLSTTSVSEVTATDPGLGIEELHFKSSSAPTWKENIKYEHECRGVQCPPSVNTQAPAGLFTLPNGEDTVEVESVDPVGLTASTSAKIKVDESLPYNIKLMGLPPANQFGNKQYPLYATAQEGSGSLESSGIASMSLTIDGKSVGVASGSCAPGPCTAESAKEGWVINGSAYATGTHSLLVSVTSNTGVVGSARYTVFMGHSATPVPLGPGSVNPATGEYLLSSTDAALSGPGASLSVRRSYDSYHLTGGAEGPLGAQWSISVGGTQSLVKTPEGSVVLTGGEGQASVFTSRGKGEFESPTNSASLRLAEVSEGEKTKEFLLSSTTGTVTKFSLPSGGTGSTWVPASTEGPAAASTVTYSYQTVGGITEPTEALGPVPAGVSCTASLVKGCRALGFVYGTATVAKGNKSSEWGEFKGRLKEVTATVWNPAEGKMSTTAIAQYTYDGEGRLRGEWDPRISPALKTTYGYDTAGHVTAMTPPGQQPWLLTYGTSGDTRQRLISVTRPSAATATGNGIPPANTVAPTLSSTSSIVGVALKAVNGTWSNSPLSYGYQWEACKVIASKEVCTPILGATSQSYTPTTSNIGYELTVQVTVSNSDGSVTLASNISSSTTGGFYERKLEFGKEGTAEGQLKKEAGVAIDGSGNVWIADTANNRIEEFNSAGTFLHAYGKEGTGAVQFKEPKAIAISQFEETTYIFVADSGNNRIQVLNSSGEFVTTASTPSAATGITAAQKNPITGKIYVALPGSNEIAKYEFNWAFESLEKKATYGKAGSGNGEFNAPTGIASNDAGSQIYVTDPGNHRVQIIKAPGMEYSGQFGTSGTGNGQFSTPGGIVVEPTSRLTEELKPLMKGLSSDVMVADTGDKRIQQFSETGVYQTQYAEGEAQGMAVNRVLGETDGNVYFANTGKSNITEWIPGTGATAPEPPNPGTSAVTTVEYNVPVSGAAAPYALGKTEAETWGEKDDPSEGTAIFPADEPMGWPAKDYKRATVYYLDSNGHTVNTVDPGGATATAEYNSKGDVERTLSPDNRAAALKEGSKSAETSKLLDTENTYNTEGTELQSTLGPQHKIALTNGTQVLARHHTLYNYDEGAPIEGGPYGLPTKTTEGAQYSGKEEDIRETTTSYSGQESLGWKLRKPTSVTADTKGLKVTHTTVYEASTGGVKETVMPAGNPKEKSAHTRETIYYTAAKNISVPTCGERPEWANLPCRTEPAKQPETSGLPNLPVITITYNIWDEPEKTVEEVGATTRTKTATFDTAGRLKTSTTNSTVGSVLPSVTDEYSETTGSLEKLSITTEGKVKTITSTSNKLGELTAYTDADENVATDNYDIDGRIEKTNDGKGTQTYTYDTTSGALTKLVDSAAGTFTAAYDGEGKMTSEGYPNGMTATYTYDSTGGATALEYKKTTHCTEKCTWFSDAVVPSIHGQWLEQASTLSKQAYKYDNANRLTQVQSTPVGKGCTTRIYGYDEDTNRTSLKTYEPGAEGKCATEKGIEESETYDTADRLTGTGAIYNTFGDITALPAADAGGSELTSTFYVDNQLQSQTQNGETIGYNLDPAGRTRETVSTGKIVATVINHYAGSGEGPAWTSEISGNWKRNIGGIAGGLVATQNSGETPVLQLTNLHGDIVATAYLSETATELASKADTTEFGVPATSAPGKYSWLGAHELSTELSSGVIAMGARSYIPQLGRFLQPDPIPGGSANAYAYTFGDPVNSSDPSGALTYGFSSWLEAGNNQQAQEVVAREAAREALEREEAERRAAEARAAAAEAGSPIAGEGEEGEEWQEGWEEEWELGPEGESEDAAFGPSPGGQNTEAAAENGNTRSHGDLSSCQPQAGEQPCTARAMGMAGMETTAAQSTVRWCTHHPYAYYHSQSVYSHCQRAAKNANPGSDECHMWGALITLVGLPEGDVIPVLVARAVKAMGLGMLIAC